VNVFGRTEYKRFCTEKRPKESTRKNIEEKKEEEKLF
jgi:hypothetical protein